MSTESSVEVGNGASALPMPVVEPVVPTLEDELTAEIEAIVCKDTQAMEVYEKFLCEARALARAGKPQLALRKRKAARCVRDGGGNDE